MGKGKSSKVDETEGVYDPGAFKLDHLMSGKLILFHKISTFLLILP